MSKIDIQDFHLLITRPAYQAADTQQFFAEKQLTSTCLPVLSIEEFLEQADESLSQPAQPVNEKQRLVNDCLAQLDLFQHVIFISANAAHAGMRQINQCDKPFTAGVTVWAIGEATAEALLSYGIKSRVAKGSHNSEALLADPELKQVKNQQILIFRGEGGRHHLAKVLEARGAHVRYCEVYRRTALMPAAGLLQAVFRNHATPVLLIMSVESLDAFEKYAKSEALLECCKSHLVLAPGLRIQNALAERQYQHVICAERANLNVLYYALARYKSDNINSTL